mgnify:CR=1 FL=1
MAGDESEYPSVPHDRLLEDGWELRSKSEETVFRMATAAVVGHTLVYNDARLRGAIEAVDAGNLLGESDGDRLIDAGEASGDGGPWRFFFATRLSFQPPLAPGIGPAAIRPTVASRAKRSFAEDLEARGFESVESGRGQRIRTDSGDRARLRKFSGHLPLSGAERAPDRIDIEGWLAVWVADGTFRIAGGAYPVRGLDELLESLPAAERSPTDPGAFREELLDAIRAVR